MKLTLTINMDNAAFADAPLAEAVQILRRAIEDMENGWARKPLRDSNGNEVGRFDIE